MKVQLFDKQTINALPWPNTPDGIYAKKFLSPFVTNGVKTYIQNVNADLYAMTVDDLVLPVLAVHNEYNNSYVCSPYGHYVTQGLERILFLQNRMIHLLARPPLHGLGQIGKLGHINSVVYINNSCFSTDLYPKGISKEQVQTMLDFLIDRFPKHAIIMRSLNPIINGDLLKILPEIGFQLIPSRKIYLTDGTNESIFQTRIVKSDLKLCRETSYEFVDGPNLTQEDRKELLALYHKLYIKQHTTLNPQFTEKFVDLILDSTLLNVKVLKSGKTIDGMLGYFERNGVLMCPFFGFDKKHAKHTAIYRLLCTTLLLEAQKEKAILHQSAGASFYKTIRRAQGCIESMGVYTKHLSTGRRVPWHILKGVVDTFATPYMEKY